MTAPGWHTYEGRGRTTALVVFLCGLVAVLLAVPIETAGAIETESFRIEPHPLRVAGYERRTFSFDVEPGSKITDAVRLTNLTDEPRRFRLSAKDAQRDPESGAVAVGSRGTTPVGMGTWIDLAETELVIPARGSQVIGFTFQRPEGEDVSGFGAIVAEEVLDASGPGVDVVRRLALLVGAGGRDPDLGVAEPQLDIPLAIVASHGQLTTTITNDTLDVVRASVRFSVSSLTGRTWAVEPVDVSLDPGEQQVVGADWSTVPRWGGILHPTVEVSWERGSYLADGTRGVYPPLWLLALAIVAVGIRGLRELWSRRQERGDRPVGPAPDREHRDDPRVEELVGS